MSNTPEIDLELLRKECTFKAVRSGGSGGQHVNKVSSKVELTFSILSSSLFSEEQKQILSQKLESKLQEGMILRVVSDAERSQYRNREDALQKLASVLSKALQPVKKRKKTGVPKSVQEKRIDSKKKRSEVKRNRKPPEL